MQSTKAALDLRGLTLVIIACAWLAGILLDSWLMFPLLVPLIGAGAAVLLVVLLWRDGPGRLLMFILLFLLLGACCHARVSPKNDLQSIKWFVGDSKLAVRGMVVDEPALQGRSRVMIVEVSGVSVDGGSTWQKADGQLEARTSGALIEDPYGANYGDNVELKGKLQPRDSFTPAGVFATMAFPRIFVDRTGGGNPIIATLYHLRVTLAGIIAQSLPQPEAAILIAILLGLQTPALRSLSFAFSVTGTTHLTVSSGFKVTVLAGLVTRSTGWLFKSPMIQPGTRLLPAQKRRERWRWWLETALVIAVIAAYTVVSGAGPAAIRAGIMGSLLRVASRLGRIYNVYTALGFAALVMSAFDPFVLGDVGFQLTFLGTLGIVLLTPFFQRVLRPLEHLALGHYVAEILAVTLAAMVATWPIVAVTFHNISFIAPVANVLTVPLLGPLIFLGVLVCVTGLLYAPLGVICGWVAWPLLRYIDFIVMLCSMIPGYVPIPEVYPGIVDVVWGLIWAYYGILALLTQLARRWASQHMDGIKPPPLLSRRAWRTIQVGAALLMIVATGTTALAAQPDGRLTITFLSIGRAGMTAEGEAILIHTPDGKTMLIDGGIDPISLGQELNNRLPFWQRSLDVVMLTNDRADHLAGLQDIVSRYQVGEVLDAGMLHPGTGYALWRRTITERGLHYLQVRQGTTVSVGSQVSLQVLWPPSPLHSGGSEVLDNTLVVRLTAPGLRLLLLGTAALSKFALTGLLSTIDPGYLQADVVQVVGQVDKDFPSELNDVLQAAHPALLLITPSSLSPKQRKGGETSTVLPASSTGVMNLAPTGATSWQVMQTAQLGTLEVSSSGNGWTLQPG